MRWRTLILFLLFAGTVGGAVIGTYRVVDEVRDPRTACVHQLPKFESLQIVSVERDWKPPLVHCEYYAALVDQLGSTRVVHAVTAKNLIVVGVLDVLAMVALVTLKRRWLPAASG